MLDARVIFLHTIVVAKDEKYVVVSGRCVEVVDSHHTFIFTFFWIDHMVVVSFNCHTQHSKHNNTHSM